MIALGIVSAPHEYRSRLRTRFELQPFASSISYRFVLGTVLNETDLFLSHVSDSTEFSCAGKTYDWYARAPLLFPKASWIGKMDDDTFLFAERLVKALTPLSPINSYAGRFLSASFRTDHMSLCYGDCRRCHSDKCNVSEPTHVIGPFRFAIGALHLMGRDVALRLKIPRYKEVWCKHEDVTLGAYLSLMNVTRIPLTVVDVQELHMYRNLRPIAVHRIKYNPRIYGERARKERLKNKEFLKRGIPEQFHLKHLHEANKWFLKKYVP